MTERQPARFTGIQIHPDPDGLFRFRYALNWHVYPVAGQPDGILVSPQAAEPKTWLAVWKQVIGTEVTAQDFPTLRNGLDAGLMQVGSRVEILSSSEERIGDMVRFERIITFEQDGEICKRRVWLIYAGKWQISLVYHAESIEDFDYWLAMANYSFATFELSEHLYFTTDTNLVDVKKGATAPRRRRRHKTS